MRQAGNRKSPSEKIAFIGFLLLVCSLAIQKPALVTIAGRELSATDLIFPLTLFLFLIAVLLRAVRLRWHRLYFFLAAYVGAFVLSAAFSTDFRQSWTKVFATLYLVCVSVISLNLISDRRKLKVSILIFLIASLIPVVVGLSTIATFYAWPDSPLLPYFTYHFGAVPVGNYPRLSSTFVSASMLCNFLNVALILAIIAFDREWISRRFFWVGFLAIAVCSIFTISAGLEALFLAIGIWLFYKAKGKIRGRLALIAGIGICALSLVFSFFTLRPNLTTKLLFCLPVTGNEVYPSGRLLVWSEALQTFSQNVLIGKGPGSASAAVVFQNSEGTYSLLTDAHNSFLSVASQTGIFGLAAFIALILYLFKAGFRGPFDQPIRAGLGIAFLTAFVVQGLTGSFEDARHLWFLIGALAASESISESASAGEFGSGA